MEQLGVVNKKNVFVDDRSVAVEFVPTIPNCTLAAIIGISIKVKLSRALPVGYKIKVRIARGAHEDEENLNKQINDKERVFAAMENDNMKKTINSIISATDDIDIYLNHIK